MYVGFEWHVVLRNGVSSLQHVNALQCTSCNMSGTVDQHSQR